MQFTIPVIILSTLTGTANFGVNSLLPDPSYERWASAIIGGVSLITGMISTVANFLRYAQSSEAHRVAGISWGKFQRFVSTELALHPNERMDAMSFLKMSRIELDRLIEQAPSIPDGVISAFLREFKGKKDIKFPEIAGGIEHTKVFVDRDSRLVRLATDAVFMIKQKKGLMREMILDDLDKKIASKTKAERDAQEAELLAEVVKTAKDVTTKTILEKIPRMVNLGPPGINVQGTTAVSPPKIPVNTVVNAKATFEKPGDPKSIASIAKQAAAAAAKFQQRPPSPNTIRLEITEKE